jgi:hypothetical protein
MIPSFLWQTWKTHTLPKTLNTQSNSWNQSNPELQKTLMNDAQCADFIKDKLGDEVYELYMALPQPIMRADFWRVAVVYINGGYYSDLDLICNESVTTLIPGQPKAVFTRELNNISNFFFGAEPKHPVIKLALDYMIEESKDVTNKEVQSYGMHSLHRAVREYYNVIDTNYISNEDVVFLDNETLKNQKRFMHNNASLLNDDPEYISWRQTTNLMNKEREEACDILFFTTFNKNGYDLYGKEWVRGFINVANYFNKFRANIYYEGFTPTIQHPSINWIKYEEAIPNHLSWKKDFLQKSNHSDYVRTMTVRFSHKAFVIQHALDNNTNDYLIWLDGDCLFKNTDYTNFPKNIMNEKFLACQIEHNHDLNHVESGILIFDGKHSDKDKFNNEFKMWYKVNNILPMGQPYDGFLVYKSLLTSGLSYVDLNQGYGKGGIQSDPNMTFCHPEIQSKFIHNIGWTGKNQYQNWDTIYKRDDIYKKMNGMLFGTSKYEKLLNKKKAMTTLERLRSLKNKI